MAYSGTIKNIPMVSVGLQSLHPLHSSWSKLTGDQFLSNLLSATKSLLHFIWNQPQDGSDGNKLRECVEGIRANADESDPVRSPDPFAFISVFARVLYGIVPFDIVQRRKGEIYEVMGELEGIVREADGSSWSFSRKRCVEFTRIDFDDSVLSDPKLIPTLTKLAETWNT